MGNMGPRQLIREMQEQLKKKQADAVRQNEDTYKIEIADSRLFETFMQRCEKEGVDVNDKAQELIERHMMNYRDSKMF